MSKAITANRLTDGRVVYWTSGQDWAETIGDAAVFADEAALAAALGVAQGPSQSLVSVGAYAIDVAEGDAGASAVDGGPITPAGRKIVRETIRVHGPTAGSLHLTTPSVRMGALSDTVAPERC